MKARTTRRRRSTTKVRRWAEHIGPSPPRRPSAPCATRTPSSWRKCGSEPEPDWADCIIIEACRVSASSVVLLLVLAWERDRGARSRRPRDGCGRMVTTVHTSALTQAHPRGVRSHVDCYTWLINIKLTSRPHTPESDTTYKQSPYPTRGRGHQIKQPFPN